MKSLFLLTILWFLNIFVAVAQMASLQKPMTGDTVNSNREAESGVSFGFDANLRRFAQATPPFTGSHQENLGLNRQTNAGVYVLIHVITLKGSIQFPGEYALRQGMTLTSAIGKAGGFSSAADTRKVKLIRAQQETIYDLQMLKPDGSNNPVLRDGDEIMVPEIPAKVLIGGVFKPGDSVIIEMEKPIGAPPSTRITLQISPKGTIQLPDLTKPIPSTGISTRQLTNRINEAYQKSGLDPVPLVKEIFMGHPSVRSTAGSLDGAAPVKPEASQGCLLNAVFSIRYGSNAAADYPLRAGTTLLAAINRAGGMDGKVSKIKILRGGKELIFDVRKIHPDGSHNPALMDGDEIVVPALSEKPSAAGFLKPGDTVLIALKEPASESDKITTVYTVSDQGTVKLPLLKQEIPASGLSVTLFARNIEIACVKMGIFKAPIIRASLPPLSKISEKTIIVAGEVRSAGEYPWTKGMTLREAIKRAGGITEPAALHRVKIVRNGKELVYDLRDDPMLMDSDQIIVPTD